MDRGLSLDLRDQSVVGVEDGLSRRRSPNGSALARRPGGCRRGSAAARLHPLGPCSAMLPAASVRFTGIVAPADPDEWMDADAALQSLQS